MKHSPGSVSSRWATTVLGLLLVAEGAGKLANPSGYIAALAAFRAFPASALWLVGIVWLTVELASGAGLLVAGLRRAPPPRLSFAAALGALVVSIAYATIAFTAHFRGLSVANCTCFGVYFKQRLSWIVLAQEIYMLTYTGWQAVKLSRWRRAGS